MSRLALIGLLPLALAAPAVAQTMDHSSMPGMAMPAASAPAKAKAAPAPKPAADPHAGHNMSAMAPAAPPQSSAPVAADPHAGHDMSTMAPGAMPGMAMPDKPADQAAMPEMAGHDMSAMVQPEIPKSPPPPPPTDHAADRFFSPAAMATARAQLKREHGAMPLSTVMVNLAEYQARSGADGYRWEGQAWFGGDINRLVVKSEGEGTRGEGVESAEMQALYSRAVGVYTDLQVGMRQDVEPYGRTYATVGFQSLLPYWFDVEGAAFLSTNGDLLARLEGTYDLRLTNRLILQPRAELNFAAQNTPETRTGSGLSNAELGLRLRYEIRREFAPYIGVSWDRKAGKTADYARARGEGAEATSVVVGIKAFF
ncbi:MAG: copper resistance protein CopB [Caulobacterales bacterium 32-69-10]|nr:MAG: copper resistance protein CopB [Caulobacterales bacterium 32-69-10]